jgi:tripartite-type tricarboxylate transporter receptor subunit TctC
MRHQDAFLKRIFSSPGAAQIGPSVSSRINAAFNNALTDPATRAALEKNSLLPSGGTPAEYEAFVAGQIEQWTRVAKDNHIEAEQ